ncbi:MAG: complex I NDUFA9 subunit family protein [Phycisphaerae bacterium]
MAETDRPILVTGASGFVGRRVVAHLREAGRRVRALVRPTSSRRMENADTLDIAEGDVRSAEAVTAAARGCAACIHLVGILRERGGATFEDVHVGGTAHVVAACLEAGVRRLVHMSALGTERGIDTPYFRTKAAAEVAVRESGLAWTVLRPSVIHGPRGDFMIQMAQMVTRPGPVPLVGHGLQVIQPVWVEDVARLAAGALGRDVTVGQAYAIGGPDVLTLRAFYRTVSRILLGREKMLLPVPRVAVRAGAWVASHVLANPPVTPDELEMLEAARPCDTAPVERDFEMQPAPFESTLTAYAEELKRAAGID